MLPGALPIGSQAFAALEGFVILAEAVNDLIERWEGDEARLRALGQPQLADFSHHYQAELRTWWREFQLEELTPDEAAAYSGLSYDTIRKKVAAAGKISKAGDKGRPRIRRGDLPMRPPGHADRL